jgi:hypothetical protein
MKELTGLSVFGFGMSAPCAFLIYFGLINPIVGLALVILGVAMIVSECEKKE